MFRKIYEVHILQCVYVRVVISLFLSLSLWEVGQFSASCLRQWSGQRSQKRRIRKQTSTRSPGRMTNPPRWIMNCWSPAAWEQQKTRGQVLIVSQRMQAAHSSTCWVVQSLESTTIYNYISNYIKYTPWFVLKVSIGLLDIRHILFCQRDDSSQYLYNSLHVRRMWQAVAFLESAVPEVLRVRFC